MAIVADIAPPAIGATEVALVAGLLFTILLIRILDSIRGPSVNLAGAVPVVGSALSSAVGSAFDSAHGALYAALSAQLVAFANTLSWLQTLWAQLWSTITGFADLTVTATYRLSGVIVPHLIGLAVAQLGDLVNAARAEALGRVQGLQAATLGWFHEAEVWTANLVAAARGDALSLFQTAEADAAALAAVAESKAGALFAQAEADALAAVGVERAFATGLFTEAMAAVATAEGLIGQRIEGVASQEAAALSAGVSELEQKIAAANAALAGVVAGSLAGVIADVAIIKALKCIQQCAPLGNLGQALNMLDLGLVLALAEYVAHDPQGATAFIRQEFKPVVDQADNLARATLGL
jgi:hypothetical protein